MTRGAVLTTILFLAFPFLGRAQQQFKISGVVKDQKETLPGAAIYVSGYKISTVTNNEGQFTLSGMQPGNYEILVQMIGYLPYVKNVSITDKSLTIEVKLTENVTQLNEVLIKPDPERAYHLAMFKDAFIGKTENANQCKILNTHVLITNDDKENKILTVRSNEFLVIENLALGYRIKYMLQNFEYDYKTMMIYYAGSPTFEEMKGGKAKQKKWNENRRIAYNGSVQHFFKSLYANRIREEGFVINKMATIKNTGRKPDSLINAKVRELNKGNNALTFTVNDSLAYWLKQRNMPKTLNTVNRADVNVDTLVKLYNKDLKWMQYNDALYVTYRNEPEPPLYSFSGHKVNRPPDLKDFQISIVDLLEPPVRFFSNGAVYNTKSILFRGIWAYEKIADIVPMDYVPIPKK